jgi:glycosyltransferase involved in cell wall biosynthesis
MKEPSVSVSVILSTYNAVAWLEKVMWGFNAQTFRNFELVIADDGSGPETAVLIEQMRSTVFYPIQHIWQEDEGFQKSRILNKALTAAQGTYIVMTDGDCIPRADFLEVHNQHKSVGYFLSGGYFMLPMSISETITPDDIEKQRCFSVKWLKSHGLSRSFKNNKLRAGGSWSQFLNYWTPTKATWNGHNASGWREDLLAVNGFDERMQYGGQDRELGERLVHLGIKPKQLRYSAICVHLDHKRSYKTQESIDKNKGIRREVAQTKAIWTDFGIVKK